METDSKQEFIDNNNSMKHLNYNNDDSSKDKDYCLNSFRHALVTTIKWLQMSSLFTSFFYSDTIFQIIQEKINDPTQATCVPFVLLSIFVTDMQMLDEIHDPQGKFQYTFIVSLRHWLRTAIDKLTASFKLSLSKEGIEKLAIESFDPIINILKQNDDDKEIRLLDNLSINDIENDNDKFLVEAKITMLSKFNHRKHIVEQYVTAKWDKVADYMQQKDYLKLFLVQNSEKSAEILNQIMINFQQLKIDTISIKQTVEKICDAGIATIDKYLSELDEGDAKQQNSTTDLRQSNEELEKRKNISTKVKHDDHCDAISDENESDAKLDQKANELFYEISEQIYKANFFDFPILFDEFY